MYETEVDQAIETVLDSLADVTSNGEVLQPPNRARRLGVKSFLTEAMRVLVNDLSAHLGIAGVGGSLTLLIRSNFLKRAVSDLYGPCMCAAMLYERGEWSAVSAVRSASTRGVRGTVSSLARSLVTNTVWTLPATMADRVDAYIDMVRKAHVQFGMEVVARLSRDAALLRNLFGVTGGPRQLYVTGSDPHRCAQRVVIVTYANGSVVYKPTDLMFQLLLMGTPESFQHCQAFNPTLRHVGESLFATCRADLPLVHVAAMPRRLGEYGYMEFKARQDVQTRLGAEQHFEKLGRLLAAATVFGITDLHQQNVMATANGPYLIDAEMGFSFPGNAAGSLLTHTGLADAFAPRNIPASVVGGVFAPYYDARHGAWDANTLSEPYDADEVNAGVRLAMGGPLCRASDYADVAERGMRAAVDAMAARVNALYNWTFAYRRVQPAPLARVMLDTSRMVRVFEAGVTAYLQGTLVDENVAINGTFDQWMTWYAGRFNTVPAALFCPTSPQVLYDPRGSIGATMAAGATGGVSVAGLVALRVRIGQLLMGGAVATLKQRLKTDLEQTLGVTISPRLSVLRGLAARGL